MLKVLKVHHFEDTGKRTICGRGGKKRSTRYEALSGTFAFSGLCRACARVENARRERANRAYHALMHAAPCDECCPCESAWLNHK
jgi:hypothetical protein